MRQRLFLLALLVTALSGAQTYSIPNAGFEANVGQLPPDALFASRTAVFFSDRIELRNANSTIALRVTGLSNARQLSDPIAWPLNIYFGTDRTKWRASVPHYRVAGAWQATPRGPSLTVTVSPDIFVESDEPISANHWPDGLTTVSGAPNPITYQSDYFQLDVGQAIVQTIDRNHVRISPLAATFDLTILERTQTGVVESDSTGAVAMLEVGSIAKLSARGEPLFVTRFSGDIGSRVVTSTGRTVVAGQTYGGLALTANAPRPQHEGTDLDSYIAVFGPTGQLVASTYIGGGLWTLHDTGSAVYFSSAGNRAVATPGAYMRTPADDFIGRWQPSSSTFDFITYAPGYAFSTSVDTAGNIVFAGLGKPDQVTTQGAFKREYDGRRNLYVGKISRDGSQLLWATYVPLSGVEVQPGFIFPPVLAIAPSGDLWIAARLEYSVGMGNVLVRLASDGASIRYAAGVNYEVRSIHLDAAGNMRLLGTTEFSNHFTSSHAPRRGLCGSYGYYYETRTPAGLTTYATYAVADNVAATPYYLALTRAGTVLSVSDNAAQTTDPMASRAPELACIVNAADRQFSGIAPGGLAYIFGAGLGPLQEVRAPAPYTATQLGGVRVLFNNVPARLISVQAGSILVQVPESMPVSDVAVTVDLNGSPLPPFNTRIARSYPRLLSADGSGSGTAAWIAEDGTINTSVKPGSVVAVFGTGLNNQPLTILVNGRPPEILYAGSAPGQVPGVDQINFRIPLETAAGKARITAYAFQAGQFFSGDIWPRVTIDVAR